MTIRKFLIPFLSIFFLLAADSLILGNLTRSSSIYIAGREEIRFPKFHAYDLSGRAVTDEILVGKFTAICVWSTRYEKISRDTLLSLDALADKIPEKIQMLGIVGDSSHDRETISRAAKISEGRRFTQLMANDDFFDILSRIRTVPTVLFVAPNGNLTGQPVAGQEVKLVEAELRRIINTDLKKESALREIHRIIMSSP